MMEEKKKLNKNINESMRNNFKEFTQMMDEIDEKEKKKESERKRVKMRNRDVILAQIEEKRQSKLKEMQMDQTE